MPKKESVIMATIQVVEGRNFKSTDPNGLSDPYCLIGAANPATGAFVDQKTCVRSETKRWTLSPVWKKGVVAFNEKPAAIRVEVWDKDDDKEDDFVGHTIILLDKVKSNEDKWVPLTPNKGQEKEALGDIHVIIEFQNEKVPIKQVPVTASAPIPSQPNPSASAKLSAPSQPNPPVSSQPKPATSQPTPSQPQPAPSKPQPVPSQPQSQPAPSNPKPAAPSQTTPASSQPKPAPSHQPQVPAPSQVKPAPSQPQPTPSQPKPAQPAPSQPKPAQPAPQPKPAQPVPSPSISKPPAPSQPKPLTPETRQKRIELAEKYGKLAISLHSGGHLMEAMEYYNLSSSLYSQGGDLKRANASENAALGLMMQLTMGMVA